MTVTACRVGTDKKHLSSHQYANSFVKADGASIQRPNIWAGALADSIAVRTSLRNPPHANRTTDRSVAAAAFANVFVSLPVSLPAICVFFYQ
jgi:hypothetical protein